ncbi:hypothetical protein EHO58_00005 [Leptospira selangorensis]|uniref:hypothetical protein n=1 Tax=Leptospira selangorensis TaxID=2484982 RepID=UPI001082B411|nr:hypothetical protein [Leptospira selangorensis]TGK10404.1 hypothetical protein EHO58_00005 [Leptospira selangorensis]
MKKSRAEKEIEEGSWKNAIGTGISICDTIINGNRARANFFVFISIVVIVTIGTFIFKLIDTAEKTYKSSAESLELLKILNPETAKNYLNIYDGGISRSIIISLVLLLITLVGILMALYRLHITEINKYEHFKIGLIRLHIALIYSSDEDMPVASLLDNVFNHTQKYDKQKFPSLIPGAVASDSISLILNKIDDLIKDVRRVGSKK